MVDSLRSDDEQEEALKKWLADYGKSVVTGILLAIAILFGWQGYQNKVQGDAEAASVIFQNLLLATEQDSDAAKISVGSFAEQLKVEYPASLYAQLAALHIAKIAVEQENYDEAVSQLQWVLSHKPDEEISGIVGLRLARVYLAQKKYAEVYQLADSAKEPFVGAFVDLKGDALQKENKLDEAIAAYQLALELNKQSDQAQNNRVIEMKLQSLGVNVES